MDRPRQWFLPCVRLNVSLIGSLKHTQGQTNVQTNEQTKAMISAMCTIKFKLIIQPMVYKNSTWCLP